MKKKIIGILICTLVIASFSVPMVGSIAIGPEQVSNETYGTLNQQAHYAFSKKGENLDNLAVTDSISLVGAKEAKVLFLQKYDIIVGGPDMTIAEAESVVQEVYSRIDPNARLIWGAQVDPELEHSVRTMLVVTGVKSPQIYGSGSSQNVTRKYGIDFVK